MFYAFALYPRDDVDCWYKSIGVDVETRKSHNVHRSELALSTEREHLSPSLMLSLIVISRCPDLLTTLLDTNRLDQLLATPK